MPAPKPARAPLPPRWLIRLARIGDRRLYRRTGGRLGLWRPKPGGWGARRLTTTGRQTGWARAVIVGYLEGGPGRYRPAARGRRPARPGPQARKHCQPQHGYGGWLQLGPWAGRHLIIPLEIAGGKLACTLSRIRRRKAQAAASPGLHPRERP